MDIQHDQVFKGFVTQGAAMINAVDWLYTRLAVDGEQLDLARSAFSDFSRRLDMRDGECSTASSSGRRRRGKQLKVRFIRFTDMQSTALGCQRIVLEPLDFSGDGRGPCRPGLQHTSTRSAPAGTRPARAKRPGDGDHQLLAVPQRRAESKAAGRSRPKRCGAATSCSRASSSASRPSRSRPSLVEDDKFIGVDSRSRSEKGRQTTVDRIAVNHWAQDERSRCRMGPRASSSMRRLAGATFDRPDGRARRLLGALLGHAWTSRSTATRSAPGPAFLELRRRTSDYHGEDADLNALCKGMAGEVYFGWAFWDTEIYCHRMRCSSIRRSRQKAAPVPLPPPRPGDGERQADRSAKARAIPSRPSPAHEDSGTWQHVDLEIHSERGDLLRDLASRPGLQGQGVPLSRRHRDAAPDVPLHGERGRLEPEEGRLRLLRRHGTGRVPHDGQPQLLHELPGQEDVRVHAGRARRDAGARRRDLYGEAVAKERLQPEETERTGRGWPRRCASPGTRRPASTSSTPATSICRTSTSRALPAGPDPDLQELGLRQDLPLRTWSSSPTS